MVEYQNSCMAILSIANCHNPLSLLYTTYASPLPLLCLGMSGAQAG